MHMLAYQALHKKREARAREMRAYRLMQNIRIGISAGLLALGGLGLLVVYTGAVGGLIPPHSNGLVLAFIVAACSLAVIAAGVTVPRNDDEYNAASNIAIAAIIVCALLGSPAIIIIHHFFW